MTFNECYLELHRDFTEYEAKEICKQMSDYERDYQEQALKRVLWDCPACIHPDSCNASDGCFQILEQIETVKERLQ